MQELRNKIVKVLTLVKAGLPQSTGLLWQEPADGSTGGKVRMFVAAYVIPCTLPGCMFPPCEVETGIGSACPASIFPATQITERFSDGRS